MEGVDFVYGCHLWTPLALGKVAAVPGAFMAAADFFTLTITGRGGHAGLPHTADDTVAAAAALVTDLQHIVVPADRPAQARRGHRRQPARRRRAERASRARRSCAARRARSTPRSASGCRS